jgi:hypothetical protein
MKKRQKLAKQGYRERGGKKSTNKHAACGFNMIFTPPSKYFLSSFSTAHLHTYSQSSEIIKHFFGFS